MRSARGGLSVIWIGGRCRATSSCLGRLISVVGSSCVCIAASAILTACSSLAQAQPRYSLAKGAGVPVCETYKEWAEKGQPTDDGSPISWVEVAGRYVGLEDEWPLLTKVENFVWERDVNPVNSVRVDLVPQWRGTPQQRAEARQSFHRRFEMYLANLGYQIGLVDVDNDGSPEDVFFHTRNPASTLLVLSDDRSDVDAENTERVLVHPNRRAAGWAELRPARTDDLRFSSQSVVPVADAYQGAAYQLLSYQGTIFVWFMWTVHPDYTIEEWIPRRTQHIYRIDDDGPEEVCVVGSML